MAWVVFDRVVRLAERHGLDAPLERWSAIRDEIRAEVCEHGYDAERRTFTQYQALDASVLNIPLVGFLPGSDPRVTGTIDAIVAELGRDGFVSRYSTAQTDDGLFERLAGLSNDLGLLAEEYDVGRSRQVGDFPQAFSHLTRVLAGQAISAAAQPAEAGRADDRVPVGP